MSKDIIIGKRYGKLTVVSKVDGEDKSHTKYICKCDCGNTKEIRRSSLLSGSTKSCGCLYKRSNKTIGYYKQRVAYLEQLLKDKGISV